MALQRPSEIFYGKKLCVGAVSGFFAVKNRVVWAFGTGRKEISGRRARFPVSGERETDGGGNGMFLLLSETNTRGATLKSLNWAARQRPPYQKIIALHMDWMETLPTGK